MTRLKGLLKALCRLPVWVQTSRGLGSFSVCLTAVLCVPGFSATRDLRSGVWGTELWVQPPWAQTSTRGFMNRLGEPFSVSLGIGVIDSPGVLGYLGFHTFSSFWTWLGALSSPPRVSGVVTSLQSWSVMEACVPPLASLLVACPHSLLVDTWPSCT